MKEKIIDIVTGEESYRDYTAEEIAAVEAEIAKGKALSDAEAEKATAKAALLSKLGITAEEAKLLLS